MANTLESLLTDLKTTKEQIVQLHAKYKDLLSDIALMEYEENWQEAPAVPPPAGSVTVNTAPPSKPRGKGKQPDPNSKQQRAFRMIQEGHSNAMVANRLRIPKYAVEKIRYRLSRGATVAKV